MGEEHTSACLSAPGAWIPWPLKPLAQNCLEDLGAPATCCPLSGKPGSSLFLPEAAKHTQSKGLGGGVPLLPPPPRGAQSSLSKPLAAHAR